MAEEAAATAENFCIWHHEGGSDWRVTLSFHFQFEGRTAIWRIPPGPAVTDPVQGVVQAEQFARRLFAYLAEEARKLPSPSE
jgi:hypothetical protein